MPEREIKSIGDLDFSGGKQPVTPEALNDMMQMRQKRGLPELSPQEIADATGENIYAAPDFKSLAPPQEDPNVNAFPAMTAQDKISAMMSQPAQSSYGDTPEGVVKELILNRGYHFGEALTKIQELYNSGHSYIRGLPGIDEFVNRIPGTLDLTKAKTIENVQSLGHNIERMGDWAAEKLGGAPELRARLQQPPTTEEEKQHDALLNEMRPQNITSDLLGHLPEMALFGGAEELGAIGLTKLAAKGLPKLGLAIERAREVGALTPEMVTGAATRLQKFLLGAGAVAGGSVASDLLFHPDPTSGDLATGVLANYLGIRALGLVGRTLGFGGKAVIKGAGKVFGFETGPLRRPVIDKAIEWLSNASGVSAKDIATKVDTFDKMYNLLQKAGAPEDFVNRVIKSGAETYGAEFGRYIGADFAQRGVSPEAFDKMVETVGSKLFQGGARIGYFKRTSLLDKLQSQFGKTGDYLQQLGAGDDYINSILGGSRQDFSEGAAKWFGRWAALEGHEPNILETLTNDLKPRYFKLALDEYKDTLSTQGYGQGVPGFEMPKWRPSYEAPIRTGENDIKALVHPEPLNMGGTENYYPAYSKYAFTKAKLGPAEMVEKVFKNPLEVDVGEGYIRPYAAVARMKSDPKVAAAVLQTLDKQINNLTSIETSPLNSVAENIANRMAKRFGYGSIVYKGTGPGDGRFVDLTNIKPLEGSGEKIVNNLERVMAAAGRKVIGKNIFGIAAPFVAGTGLAALYNPQESQAAAFPVEPIVEAVEKVIKPKPFIALISDLGEKFLSGLRMTHDDFYNTLDSKPYPSLDRAIMNGWVRAGRMNDGPFVEFNWSRDAARANAIRFIQEHHFPGDAISMDMHDILGEPFKTFYSKDLNAAMQLIKTGEPPIRVSSIRDFLGLIPVGVGLGAMAMPQDSEAMDWEPLVKAASKFANIDEMAKDLEPQLGALLKQASVISGHEKPMDVINFLTKVHDDVHSLSGGTKVNVFDSGPDYFGANITHDDLGGFPVAVVNGVVEADSGTWYPQVKAGPLGFGKEAMGKLFEQAKKANPVIAAMKNPLSLAGVLAATAAGTLYDTFNGTPAEAVEFPTKPFAELFKGLRGADGEIEDLIKAKSVDEILNIGRNAWQRSFKDGEAAAKDENLSSGEQFYASVENAGGTTPEAKQMLGLLDNNEGLNSLYFIRLPHSMSDNPLYQSWFTRVTSLLHHYVRSPGSMRALAQKRATEIIKDVQPDQWNDLYKAIHGMTTTSDGRMLQTVTGIPDPVNDIAKQLHQEVINPLWQVNTGIDPKAVGILRNLNLPQTRRNFEIIKAVQQKQLGDPSVPGESAAHLSAAEQTRGMINPHDWQWKNLDVPYQKAKFIVEPVEQERTALTARLQGMQETFGSNPDTDQMARMAPLVQRLKQLDTIERSVAEPLRPREDLKRPYFQPFEDRDLPLEPEQEKNPSKLLMRHIDGATTKAVHEEINYHTNNVASYFRQSADPSRHLADYMTEIVNTINGAKALRQDSRTVQILNSIPGVNVSRQQLIGINKRIMNFTYFTKLGFGLRFPIINVTQPLSTTAMVTGYGPLFRAYAKALGDFSIWDEAKEAGVIVGDVSRATSEMMGANQTLQMSKWRKAIDFLPSRSENLNRVVTYQAGKDFALDQMARGGIGGFKVPHFVRGFDKEVLGSGDTQKIAKEFGRALTHTTQFMFGPEGRPLFLSGGAAKSTLTQFKSFTAAYTDLLIGAIEHGKRTGDWAPIARGVAALLMLGGITGGIGGTGYELVRNELIKRGQGWLPPAQSGIGYLTAMAASTFGQPDTSAAVKKALTTMQLSGSFSLLNLPDMLGDKGWEEAGQFVLGPSFGPMAQAGIGLGQWMKGTKTGSETFGTEARATMPIAGSAVEALQMANVDPFKTVFDKLGYRGGMFSPTGKQLIKQQDWWGILARGLNLQPSWKSQRYMYIKDIQAALEGGQTALADKYLQEGRRMGFIFTNKDLGSVKGAATRAKSERAKPNEPIR